MGLVELEPSPETRVKYNMAVNMQVQKPKNWQRIVKWLPWIGIISLP